MLCAQAGMIAMYKSTKDKEYIEKVLSLYFISKKVERTRARVTREARYLLAPEAVPCWYISSRISINFSTINLNENR